MLCPVIALFAINTYRHPARLLIIGAQEILSAEGTTKVDLIAMALYALSIQPLITGLNESTDAKQSWFADDTSGADSLSQTRRSAERLLAGAYGRMVL